MPQNIGDNRIEEQGIARISPEDAKRLSRYLVRPGDIVYSRRGDVTRRALVREHEDGWLCGTGCLRIRFGNQGPDPRFASYYLGYPNVRDWIARHAHGATMPNLNTSILAACPFVEPPHAEQRAIAHILGTLDDKIELNRRMSETLEEMARALFESWFVRFDPVRAKMEGRDPGLPADLTDLFPDRLIDSELGENPEGWTMASLGDVAEQFRENVTPAEKPDAWFEHYSIPAFDAAQVPASEPGRDIRSQKSRVIPGSVLLSKLNPEIPRVWLVDVQCEDRAICSTEFLVYRARQPHGRAWLYCLLRSSRVRDELQGMATGTSKSHQRVPPQAILRIEVPKAPDAVAQTFERLAQPLLKRVLLCRRESRTLAALRDKLLPKLVSGDLRVKDAERLVAAAT